MLSLLIQQSDDSDSTTTTSNIQKSCSNNNIEDKENQSNQINTNTHNKHSNLNALNELYRLSTMIKFVMCGNINILSQEQRKLLNKWTACYKKEEIQRISTNKPQELGEDNNQNDDRKDNSKSSSAKVKSWNEFNATLEQKIILIISSSKNMLGDNDANEKIRHNERKSIEEKIMDRIHEKGIIKFCKN